VGPKFVPVIVIVSPPPVVIDEPPVTPDDDAIAGAVYDVVSLDAALA